MINMTSDFSTCVWLSLKSFVVKSSLTESQLSCFSHDRVTLVKCPYLGRGHRILQPAAMNSSSKQIWWQPRRRVEIWRIDSKWKSICRWRLSRVTVVAEAIKILQTLGSQRRSSMLEDYTACVCELQSKEFVVACLTWKVFSWIDCNALMQNTVLICFLIEFVVAILMLIQSHQVMKLSAIKSSSKRKPRGKVEICRIELKW